MRFIKITKTIFALTLLIASLAHANETPEAKEGEGEKAEGAAEGGGSKNSEFIEYSKRLNKMTQLQAKVKESTEHLKELIAQKNHGGHAAVKDEKGEHESVLGAIVTTHKELTDNTGLYNEELRAISYRFPSKGEEISRKYIPLRPKSLEQVEKEMGLDGELTALKDKVDAKYKAFAPPEEPKPAPKPVHPESTLKDKNAEKPMRLKLVK